MAAQMTLDDLISDFEFLPDWESRYSYIVDLGKNLPPMEDALKVDANKVRGCTSQVWLVAEEREGLWYFTMDSDAIIVRGLLGVLRVAYDGKATADVQKVPIDDVFQKLGLAEHLSPNRRNGFTAMVDRIQQDVAE